MQLLNQRLQRPISRQLFSQSIMPELLRTGYAKSLGRDIAIDGAAWCGWWIGYIALRERMIATGEWQNNRPYSANDAEDYRDGHYDDLESKERGCLSLQSNRQDERMEDDGLPS